MKIIESGCGYRFRNKSDAMKAIGFLLWREKIPPSLIVAPHNVIDGMVVPNKEYQDAPFELCLVDLSK